MHKISVYNSTNKRLNKFIILKRGRQTAARWPNAEFKADICGPRDILQLKTYFFKAIKKVYML